MTLWMRHHNANKSLSPDWTYGAGPFFFKRHQETRWVCSDQVKRSPCQVDAIQAQPQSRHWWRGFLWGFSWADRTSSKQPLSKISLQSSTAQGQHHGCRLQVSQHQCCCNSCPSLSEASPNLCCCVLWQISELSGTDCNFTSEFGWQCFWFLEATKRWQPQTRLALVNVDSSCWKVATEAAQQLD